MNSDRCVADFAVRLTWRDNRGRQHRAEARCQNASSSGLQITSDDLPEQGTAVQVECLPFKRMGRAVVKYCRHDGLRYTAGIHFDAQTGLEEAARRRILEDVSVSVSR